MPEDDDEQTIAEQISDSMQSKDRPLDKRAPGAPFALVGLAYPLILIVALLLAAAYFFFR
ncbi:MAG: hypothetical protein EA381_19905 [Planctomycetaceae bacterium]|nr:MAG: hypothetical protein EA381_19905 [Planctomycetaceae bacterium]